MKLNKILYLVLFFISVAAAVACAQTKSLVEVRYGYGSVDPYRGEATAPLIENQASVAMAPGGAIELKYSARAVDKFLVVQVPDTEGIKKQWFFSQDNYGKMGDATFRLPVHVGRFYYYISRDAAGVAFNPSHSLQLRN